MRPVGICKLCQNSGPLVESHIIPNFHFKSLKEDEGFYYVLSTDSNKKELKKQKGPTEHLLCEECDNVRFGRYEKHLAEVIFGGHELGIASDGRLLRVKDYDYKKIKNALLSILWRMSVSTHQYFKEVRLGSHEEILRIALLSDAVFDETEYPILLTAPYFEGSFLGDLILPPDSARFENNRAYRCLISGLIFTFIVGSAPLSKITRGLILGKAEWPIIKAKVEEIPFLYHTVIRLGKARTIRNAD